MSAPDATTTDRREHSFSWEDPTPTVMAALDRSGLEIWQAIASGALLAEGTVIHRGGTIATAEGRLTAESDGRLLAHATTTCMILRPR
jgi:hypothetical protein